MADKRHPSFKAKLLSQYCILPKSKPNIFYKSCKLLDENFNCIALLLYYKYRFVSHEHLKYSVILIVLFKKLRSGLRPLNLRVWGGCAGTYKFYSEPSSVKSEPAMWSSVSVSYNFRVCFTGLMLWWPLIGPLYPRSQERRRRGLSVTFLSCVRVRQVN